MRSEQLDQLAAALVAFQSEAPAIERSATVSVTTKSGGKYSFDYAPLDAIVEAVRPLLAKHGLAVSQSVTSADNGAPALETLLLHVSGQFTGSTAPLPRPEDIKAYGANITYMRRYQLVALLNLVTADDVDAAEPGDTVRQAQRKPAQQRQRVNGNGHKGQTPEELLQTVEPAAFGAFVVEQLPGAYKHVNHVKNAMKKEGIAGAQLDTPNGRVRAFRKLKARKEPDAAAELNRIAFGR